VQTRLLAGAQQHLYGVSADGFTVTVGLVPAGVTALSQLPAGIVRGLDAAGSKDARATHVRMARDNGIDGLDWRISFTTTKDDDKKAIWLARAVIVGDSLVLMQTIAFEPAAAVRQYTNIANRIQARVVLGLRLPTKTS
jgi:hypothetical protein